MKITNMIPKDWRNLQDEACRFLNEAGYFAESPKKIKTVRGAVEVDVYVESKIEILKSFICECKHWSTPIPKEKVHAFRTVTSDSGSMLGIIISKNGFQSGAYEAANCSNVLLKDWEGFIELIKAQWIINQIMRMKNIASPLAVYTDPLDVPFEKLSENDKINYKKIGNYCIGAYIAFISLRKDELLGKKIVVNDISFTALEELFNYFEVIFSNAIKQYEKLFEHNPVEKWKLEFPVNMLFLNIEDIR